MNNKFFANFDETLKCNKPQLYSILGDLNESYQINGSYEFLLEYPSVIGYNRWIQSLLPQNNNDALLVQGYKPISISWNYEYWNGLVRSTVTHSTLIDGSVGSSNWYYSIGCIYSPWAPNFPGPNSTLLLTEVSLWIRVKDEIKFKTLTSKSNFNLKLFLIVFLNSF